VNPRPQSRRHRGDIQPKIKASTIIDPGERLDSRRLELTFEEQSDDEVRFFATIGDDQMIRPPAGLLVPSGESEVIIRSIAPSAPPVSDFDGMNERPGIVRRLDRRSPLRAGGIPGTSQSPLTVEESGSILALNRLTIVTSLPLSL